MGRTKRLYHTAFLSLLVVTLSITFVSTLNASFYVRSQSASITARSTLLDQPTNRSGASGSWVEIGSGSASGGGISQNSGESRYPAISAASNGSIYVAWDDLSAGDREIYVRRWNGSSWEALGGSASGGGISNNGGDSQIPKSALATNGNYLITWCDDSAGDFEIYVKQWNGSSWLEAGSGSASGGGISNNSGDSLAPKIAVAPNGTPYICWIDDTSGDWEIYVRRFLNGAWQEVGSGSASGGGISNNEGLSRSCTLALDSTGVPYVGWRDDSGGNLEVYVRKWNGSNWVEIGTGSAQGGGVSNTPAYSGNPKIRIDSGDMAGMTWNDQTVRPNEIYYRKWNGSEWVENGSSSSGGGISNNSGDSFAPFLEYKGLTPYIAWHDDTSGDYEIFVRRWTGESWAELGSGSATHGGISNNAGESLKPATIFGPDGAYYVVWYDDSSGDSEIYVKKWIESKSHIPLPPTDVTASDGIFDDKIKVAWNGSEDATFYQVFRSETVEGIKSHIGDSENSLFDDELATPGQPYYYWVKACNFADCSDFSSWDIGWRSGPIPAIPGNVQASDGEFIDRVRVTWSSSVGASHYEIYRSKSSEGARTLLASPTNNVYDDSTAEAELIYYYWAKACNALDCSEYSDFDEGYLKEVFSLTLVSSGQGDVDVNPDKLSFEPGETITLTAIADTDWLFTGWSGDLSGENNPATLLMDADKFVTALFELEDNGEEVAFKAYLPVNLSGHNNSAAYKH